MDKKTVTAISYLSRLKIDDENEEKIINDLGNIIEFVDQLNDVDTSKGSYGYYNYYQNYYGKAYKQT